ncbi:HAD hydrolase family protein [bacterium]|nr:HAD hydrolase family protein [bacterium]
MKNNILFVSDLDNTLLYSVRRLPEGIESICVERLNGKEQGFFSLETVRMLKQILQRVTFVPVTTRSLEQYRRIKWPWGEPPFALAANGGLLLENGEENLSWREASLALVKPYERAFAELEELVSADGLACRRIDGLFLFTPCRDAAEAEAAARLYRSRTELDIETTGRKLYAFPPPLNKGTGLERLLKSLGAQRVICAGDSEIDLPMLKLGDLALVPSRELFAQLPANGCLLPGRDLFAHELLQQIQADLEEMGA